MANNSNPVKTKNIFQTSAARNDSWWILNIKAGISLNNRSWVIGEAKNLMIWEYGGRKIYALGLGFKPEMILIRWMIDYNLK